jgi:hypothetical protein
MMYAYEDLSPEQFETLIVLLCQRLLGTSVKGFAKGPDAGRDAKFVGTAELHPSKAAPWMGTVIIQAKHTNGYNRHFGEVDFYNPKSANTVQVKKFRVSRNCARRSRLITICCLPIDGSQAMRILTLLPT